MTTTRPGLQHQSERSTHENRQQSSSSGESQPRLGQPVERVRINQADEGREDQVRKARRAEY